MLYWIILAPILTAVLIYLIRFERAGKALALIMQALLTAASFVVFLNCRDAEIVTNVGNYEGFMGIILKADTLSSVLVMLTALLFLVAAVYNLKEKIDRLFLFLMFIWEALLIGIFLSCDLFNIFVLLEVASVVVSILIMFKRNTRSMYDGMVYLMANTVAIQFYLIGTGYIYKLTGTLDMDAAASALSLMDKSSLALPFALLMTSISLKCALMPLFSWLPRAHGTPGAPASVSALLSGLHIKTGVYLFIRFQSIFQIIDLSGFFLIAGIITGIAGFVLALSQTDIKLILAYHTISQIGMIMIGLNVGDVYSHTGGIYHILNHAFFKSALFLSAGIIIDSYGTRNIYKIRGVMRRFPVVGAATLMAVLGITGAPFFNGSISKYFIISGTSGLITWAMLLINLGTIISFIKYLSMLFGKPEGGTASISLSKQAAIIILGFLCLAGGIFGEPLIKYLFGISVSIDTMSYAQKSLVFAASVILGYLIYNYFVKTSTLFKRIREIELSFKGICVSIGIFFVVILMAAKA